MTTARASTLWILFVLLCAMLLCFSGAAFAAVPSKQKAAPAKPVLSTKLPRATPESKGINSLYIIDMLNELEKRNMELHSVLVAVDGQVIFEGHFNPYGPDNPYIIHSLTKLFTNTAAGIAYTNGKLKMTDKPVDYFPNLVPKDAGENLKAMTAKDLITMRSGHDREISGNEWRPLKTSWLEAFMKEPVVHKPGSKYKYSSGNSYMLSAMVQKAMGKDCAAVLQAGVLPKLGIRQFSWMKSPEGICSGGNGVMVTPEDILKIAILYLQKGMWNGERLLTEDWCDMSLGLKDAIADGQQAGRGYHWQDRGGVYTAGGAFGQAAIVVPDLNMAVVITGGTTAPYNRIYAEVLKQQVVDRTKADAERKYDAKYAQVLKSKGDRLNLAERVEFTTSPLVAKINGKAFTITANKDQITKIKLDFGKDSVNYVMTDQRGTHTVKCGLGSWISGTTTMTGNYLHHQYQDPIQKVYASATWVDDNTLKMTWTYPEMAFRDFLTIKLTDNTISMVRSVNANSKGPFGGMVRPEVNGKIK